MEPLQTDATCPICGWTPVIVSRLAPAKDALMDAVKDVLGDDPRVRAAMEAGMLGESDKLNRLELNTHYLGHIAVSLHRDEAMTRKMEQMLGGDDA